MAGRHSYEFGRFRLDASGRVLFREGQTVPLTPKAAEALLMLVENAGNVVDKDGLLKRIWPDTFIEEGSLTRTVSILRKALGDGGGQNYIVTIPKRGYRFTATVEKIPEQKAPSSTERIMLAVLPFENLSDDRQQEYFSDGLTEEMITQLGRLNPERLGVIARTSSMQYKSTDKSIQQIGRDLGVSYVMEGSVRREGNRVRIAAQLIQVSDQTHLWAESYERDLGKILTLQNQVAKAIAKEIEIKLTPQEEVRLGSAGSVDPEAHEAYLKGRYLWSKRTLESLQKSIAYFERATQIDPNYAIAYAGMADSYLTLQDDTHLSPEEGTRMAKSAAAKALRIDETLAEPHISLAHAHFHLFNWRLAGREFKRGLDLNPGYATAHFYFANYLTALGRLKDAYTEAQRALALDPLSLPTQSNLAMVFYHSLRFDDAIEQSLRTLEMDPSFARSYEDLGRAYEQKGMYEQALEAFEKATALSGRSTPYLAQLAHANALTGRKKEAVRLLREIKQVSTHKYVSSYGLALVYLALGNLDETFDWLEKAFQEHSSSIPFLRVNPRFAGLRSHPRFRSLLRRIGLSPLNSPPDQSDLVVACWPHPHVYDRNPNQSGRNKRP